MRRAASCLALVALVCGGATAGCSTQTSVSSTMTAAPETTPAVTRDPNVKYHQVSLKVPTMSCPFACWPKVKKTLESQPGVGEVTLAPQKESDTIDNPVVLVQASDSFQGTAAIDALSQAGFSGAELQAGSE